MTATQFSQMLDKQEATMDSQSVQQQPTNKQKLNKSSPVKTKTKSSSQNQNKNDLITTSFLDQEAMIPFKKLRQVKNISFDKAVYLVGFLLKPMVFIRYNLLNLFWTTEF